MSEVDEPGGMMAAGPGFEQDVAVETIWKLAVGVCIGENCNRAFISRERFDEHIAPLLKLATPPAVWSRERPTEPGWYWLKCSQTQLLDAGITMVLVTECPFVTKRVDLWCPSYGFVDTLDGSWAGPLRPPVEGK